MNIKQVKKFYESKKNTPCPITERLIKSGYQQKSNGYIKYAHKIGIIVDYEKAMPTQWWHLIECYCMFKDPSAHFTKRIQCGKLLLWMAETAKCMSERELNDLVDDVLIEKNNRRRGNRLIKNKCFEEIVKKIESVTSTKE